MKFSEFSVKNSLFVNLLSLLILLGGTFYGLNLRREAFPPVSFDVVTVTTGFRGASPDKVEKLVTTPLENEIKEVDDIKEISSSSYEGLSSIAIELVPGTDLRKAVDDKPS